MWAERDGRKGRRTAQLNGEADDLFFSTAYAAVHDWPAPGRRLDQPASRQNPIADPPMRRPFVGPSRALKRRWESSAESGNPTSQIPTRM